MSNRDEKGHFLPGHGLKGPGRPKGSPAKTTKALKEAILEAGRVVGSERDPDGEDGLVSYLKDVARKDEKTFCGLLGKVLPMTVTGDEGGPIELTVKWQGVGGE